MIVCTLKTNRSQWVGMNSPSSAFSPCRLITGYYVLDLLLLGLLLLTLIKFSPRWAVYYQAPPPLAESH